MSAPTFEWDEEKNRDNHAKHGVSFEVAQTPTGRHAFGSLVRATGARERRRMKKQTVKYTDGEIGRLKVTLSLSRKSVDFFKRAAKKQQVSYQRMIRALVDAYAEREER
jgi:uncharacterized DUF497 family protein